MKLLWKFICFLFLNSYLFAREHNDILFGPIPMDVRDNRALARLASFITEDKKYRCSAIVHESDLYYWYSTNCTLMIWDKQSQLSDIKKRYEQSSSLPFWERMTEELICSNNFFDVYLQANIIERLKGIQFDMIICDGQSIPCLVTGAVLKIEKTINFSPICPPPWSSLFKRHPSYAPSIYTSFDNEMTFSERIISFFNDKANSLKDNVIMLIIGAKLISKGYLRYLYRLLKTKDELYMAQCITGFNYPEYHPPNVIDIGSISANPPQVLSSNLNNFMIKFDHIVYFRMKGMEDFVNVSNLLDSFKKYPEIGFVFESEHYSNYSLDYGYPYNLLYVPSNLSNDILGHPKTSASINYGDWESILESLYHGVPLVSIGNTFDKGANGKLLEYHKVGISMLNESEMNSELFFTYLQTLLKNPKYKVNAIKVSHLVKERNANSTMKDWIDYYFDSDISELVVHGYFHKGSVRFDRILIGLLPIMLLSGVLFLIHYTLKKVIQRVRKIFTRKKLSK